MSSDLLTSDLSPLSNDDLYAVVESFVRAQPSEGWQVEYTVQWEPSALKDVAALANTFGGVLIVGVKKEKTDPIATLVGVASDSEYKTGIASSIATNLVPIPPYSIFECVMPEVPSKRVCVVRVRESRVLHLITSKDSAYQRKPVFVRNEDVSEPASASQLRWLIERQQNAPTLGTRVSERGSNLRHVMLVGSGYQRPDDGDWNYSARQTSTTFLKLGMIAMDAPPIWLEESHERWLESTVSRVYPGFSGVLSSGAAVQAEVRGADFYERAVYHKNLNYESKWRVTRDGDIGHATQMTCGSVGPKGEWSVVDLATYIVLFMRLATAWWAFNSYFGNGHLFAQLNVPGLEVLRHPKDGYFIMGFDAAASPRPSIHKPSLEKHAIRCAVQPSSGTAIAECDVSCFGDESSRVTVVSSILNQLLRSLGHGADLKALRDHVDRLLQKD